MINRNNINRNSVCLLDRRRRKKKSMGKYAQFAVGYVCGCLPVVVVWALNHSLPSGVFRVFEASRPKSTAFCALMRNSYSTPRSETRNITPDYICAYKIIHMAECSAILNKILNDLLSLHFIFHQKHQSLFDFLYYCYKFFFHVYSKSGPPCKT